MPKDGVFIETETEKQEAFIEILKRYKKWFSNRVIVAPYTGVSSYGDSLTTFNEAIELVSELKEKELSVLFKVFSLTEKAFERLDSKF